MSTSAASPEVPPSSRHTIRGRESSPEPLPVPPDVRSSIRIVVVDDERTLRESCASFLEAEGYQVTVCGKGEEAREILTARTFDIALLDLYMGQVPGLELLQACLKTNPNTLVVVMTGNPTVSSSIEALRLGAWDYIPKPFSATHLQILIGRAAHTVLVGRESNELEEEVTKQQGHTERVAILGRSPVFEETIALARRVAQTDASVFITGESGTGKELIAQFIHSHSRRSSRAMVAVNCAALPEALLESEMFGHRKGAFTGAVRDKPGLLETANGGTLFLDELTEMSKPIQAKLLRVIQDGVVRRVGSETVDAVVNVRFIAATNREPEHATETGVLREDLYYRLRVFPIRMPPLRERPEDIPLLAEHFLKYYWGRHRAEAGPVPLLTQDASSAMQAYPWRGNVRELQNVIEHAVVLLEPGAEVRSTDIPFIQDQSDTPRPISDFIGTFREESYHSARDRIIAEFEQRYLKWLINQAAGNMSKAARVAGVDRTTLYRLMEKHGLQRETIMVDSDG